MEIKKAISTFSLYLQQFRFAMRSNEWKDIAEKAKKRLKHIIPNPKNRQFLLPGNNRQQMLALCCILFVTGKNYHSIERGLLFHYLDGGRLAMP